MPASLMAAVLLAATPAAGAPAVSAPPASVHRYSEASLSPAGDRIAAAETDKVADIAAAEPHGAVVVRKAAGAVVARYDTCAFCVYTGLAWSPDGRGLAFISSNRKAHSATIEVVRDGRAIAVSGFDGLLAAPREGHGIRPRPTSRTCSGASSAGSTAIWADPSAARREF